MWSYPLSPFVAQLYHPLPQGFSFTEAKVYIETLPAQDDPEVFGMNENAEKAYLVSQAASFIDTILGVQPRIMKGLIGYVTCLTVTWLTVSFAVTTDNIADMFLSVKVVKWWDFYMILFQT